MKRIAILYPISIPWMARVLDGIRAYAAEHGGWQLFTSPPEAHGTGETSLTLRMLKGWTGDGIIIATGDRGELARARRMDVPIVNLGTVVHSTHGIPRVTVDSILAGRLAADHFIERGLTQLAFFGWKGLAYSDLRLRGFLERAAESGIDCEVMLQPPGVESNRHWSQRVAEPARWLKSLPRPCGIFAVHDYRAQLLIDACQETNLRIPDDIAIVGMDNDEVVCEHSVPTLTSVSRSGRAIGWEAAALLDRMITVGPSAARDILVPPRGVISRQSTNLSYVSDPVAAAAIDYMRTHLTSPINVSHVAEHVGVSKRTLENRFRLAVNDSPRSYLARLRVKAARELIREHPDWTLQTVARNSGFRTMPPFYKAFHKVTGTTPATHR